VPSDAELKELTNLYNRGRINAALEFGTVLLDKQPDDASLNNMVGVLCARLDRFDQALTHYDRALALRGNYAEAFNNRGNVLVNQGHYDDAITSFRSALSAMPDYAAAHNGLGNALHMAGNAAEAADSCLNALRLQPDYSEAHNNHGNALLELGRYDEAAHAFSTALQLQPGLVQAHTGMGKALNALGFHRQAVEHLQHAVTQNPDSALWHNELGNALSDLGRLQDAVESYQRAVKVEPEFAQAHSNAGVALGDLGRFDEACNSMSEALRLDPGFVEAHYNLSALKTYKGDDGQLDDMLRLVNDSQVGDDDRSYLCFALGKAYEDLGDTDRSFELLADGNRLRKTALGYDIKRDVEQFEQIRSAFGDRPVSALPDDVTQRPIFIVGMPRSGTSLVEQILASHSAVHGAGELGFASRILVPVVQSDSEAWARISDENLRAIRDEYLAELDYVAPNATVVTDKMPGNFRWIGFLLTMMPGAKIVHVQRNPVATCWSMYKRLFQKNGFTNDLEDLGQYYLLYADLMDFWSERFPGQIHHLDYEKLTENQEAETRRLLEYCALPWEDACLDFHATRRAISTASGAQVRKKMYTGSSEAWRQYASHLGPLLTILNEQ